MGVLPDWMIERDIKIEPLASLEPPPRRHLYASPATATTSASIATSSVHQRLGSTVDPKHFDPKSFVDVEGDYCIIPPNSSPWRKPWNTSKFRATSFVCVWEEHVCTVWYYRECDAFGAGMARANYDRDQQHDALPAKIYAGEGIAQILFLRAEAVCRTSYADKKGK